MKILFYSPVSLVNGGGCERWHCDITESLTKQYGFAVEIITGNLGSAKWSKDYLKEQLNGTPHLELSGKSLMGILVLYPKSIMQLYTHFKQADVVHFIHGFAFQDILMLLLKFITGKKVIVGHHAPILHKIPFHNWYMENVSQYVLKLFEAQMTLNKSDKEFLEKRWHLKNVHFIPSGIKIEKFMEVKRQPHAHLNFITVGIYRLQKGIDLLLEAIEIFNKSIPNNKAAFNLAGGGELEPLVKQQSQKYKNIRNLGYIKYENMPQIYAENDVYLLPSREEPFGLVLIEAWSGGLPVLATKTEGPLDMIKPNVNGWFIEEISVTEIAKAIEKVYLGWVKDNKALKNMDKKCRETGKKFSIDETARRMRELFIV